MPSRLDQSMPAFETLAVDVSDGVASVRLDNEPVNAINQEMRFELDDVMNILREHRVRVVIFGGSESVFSVGADIALFEETADWTTPEFRANTRVLSGAFDAIEALEKPVIAAINGTCVGGGLELALACDIRIASPEATLGFPEHNIGLIPGVGGCSRFVHLVGPGKAKDMIFSGELIDGQTAGVIGLVERVDDDPVGAADDYADMLLEKPPQAVGLAKRVLTEARDTNLRAVGVLESLAQSTLIKTDDHTEGIEAFREKRDPEFTGR